MFIGAVYVLNTQLKLYNHLTRVIISCMVICDVLLLRQSR